MRLEKKRATVSGGELAYVDAGEGDAVVLLHGFPTSSFLWRREIALLASRMRVIATDLLGYGDSAKPANADLSVTAQARYVRELLAQLGVERIAVVGHDIGGGVAQLLALEGDVDTLVLLDSIAFDEWPVAAVEEIQATPTEDETKETVERIVDLALEAGLSHRDRIDEETRDGYRAPWRGDARALFRAARGIDGVGLADREADLGRLEVPTFILWGEDDPFLPSKIGERLNDVMPGSTLALLPGCSHFVNEDAPQTVGPLLFEWLRARYLGESHGHAPTGPVPVFLERPSEGGFLDLDPDGG